MLTEDPLHPEFLSLQPGDWIEWMLPGVIKQGEVVVRSGRSLLVQFQASAEPRAIPDAESYFSNPKAGQFVMRKIDAPRRIAAPTSHTMTVRQAAAKLGISTKEVRRKLRNGELVGKLKEGKWVAVSLDTGK